MAYCTLDELRAEGAVIDEADEVRMTGVCARVSEYIDLMTHNVFEPMPCTLYLDGTGGYRLDLPLCLLDVEEITCDSEEITDYVNYNRHTPDDRMNPRIFRKERPWTKGLQNVAITGTWGCVDLDAEGERITPYAIRRAALILALTQQAGLADVDAQTDEYQRRRLLSETTDGHSYTLDRSLDALIASETFSGIPEVDQTLSRYKVRHVKVTML